MDGKLDVRSAMDRARDEGARAHRAARAVAGLMTILAVVALVAAGCIWPGPDGTARSVRYQPVLTLPAADVGNLAEEWHAVLGSGVSSNPVVNGDVAVIAVRISAGSGFDTLLAFDAHGCGAAACPPIWRATATGFYGFGQPWIHAGRVYVLDSYVVAAFATRPVTGCTGDPLTCEPLWRGSESTENLSAADGVVVTASRGQAQVYEAGDGASCPGTPKTCSPVRRLALRCSGIIACRPTSASIADGAIVIGYTEGDEFDRGGFVAVFDLVGGDCAPAVPGPLLCQPRSVTGSGGAVSAPPSIHDGGITVQEYTYVEYQDDPQDWTRSYRVATHPLGGAGPPPTYLPFNWLILTSKNAGATVVTPTMIFANDGNVVRAFDQASGAVQWTTALPSGITKMAAGGGVLFVIAGGVLRLYDADGVLGCANTPTTCTPLRSFSNVVGLALSNNQVWFSDTSGALRVVDLA